MCDGMKGLVLVTSLDECAQASRWCMGLRVWEYCDVLFMVNLSSGFRCKVPLAVHIGDRQFPPTRDEGNRSRDRRYVSLELNRDAGKRIATIG